MSICAILTFVNKGEYMKKFFADFKKFISRGNIVDMAVGVIVGGAFSKIVTALTNKIIMPLINYLLSFGGGELSSAYTFLRKAYTASGEVDLANSIYIDWGAFITAIIDFLLIAFTLFCIIKIAMKSSELLRNTTNKIIKSAPTKEERKELKAAGVNLKNHEEMKTALNELRERKAAEKAAEEEANKPAPKPTTEELLADILAELKKGNKAESEEKPVDEQK